MNVPLSSQISAEKGKKTVKKQGWNFFYLIFFTRKNTVPLYFSQKKKHTLFCDMLTYFCTVPLFKLLLKELFHLGMFAEFSV